MTLRKIAHIGHPILRQNARTLTREELLSPETQRLIDDLVETMRDANGAGLAAPQIHELVMICALEVKKNPRYPYKPDIPLTIAVNPVITVLTDERFGNYEGCLSVPNFRGVVQRATEIEITYWDRQGNVVNQLVKGLTAGTWQHEVDHLHGTIFVDRVTDPKTFCTWSEFERYHLQSFAEQARALVERFGS
jgi:peptide deformylase